MGVLINLVFFSNPAWGNNGTVLCEGIEGKGENSGALTLCYGDISQWKDASALSWYHCLVISNLL